MARRIANTDTWLFELLVEFNGIFYATSTLDCIKEPDSKGNVIFIGPSFYASNYDHFIFMTGIQGACAQTLGGVFRFNFRYSIYGGWKF